VAHRVSEHGSYRIDVVLGELGRFALASGAQTKAEHEKRVAMLRELYDNGKWDVLQDLKNGRFDVRQLYAYYKMGKVGQLAAGVVLSQPLTATVEAWLPVSAKAPATRTRYEVSWHSLERAGILPANAIVRDLDLVDWVQLQRTWEGGPYDWRHLRGFVSRFLSALLRDRWHEFRRNLITEDRFPSGEVPEGRVPDLTVEGFWKCVELMPEHTRNAPVAIVATAMRGGELCACTKDNLLPLTRSVLIPGHDNRTGRHKSQAATHPVDPALWPYVQAAIPVSVSHWTLRDHWTAARKQAGVGQVTLHDLRHCAGQWLVNAGQSEQSVQQTLRHKTASMTRRYTRQRDRGINAIALGDILLGRSHSESHGGKKAKGRKRA
jgi:integrase